MQFIIPSKDPARHGQQLKLPGSSLQIPDQLSVSLHQTAVSPHLHSGRLSKLLILECWSAGPMPDKHMPTVLASTRLTEVRGFSDFCSEFFQVTSTMPACLLLCLPACLPDCLLVSVFLSVCLSVCMSVTPHACLAVRPHACLSVYLSVCCQTGAIALLALSV